MLELSAFHILLRFFRSRAGNLFQKAILLWRLLLNVYFRIPTASTPLENLILVTAVLNLEHEREGVVVECGTYKGGRAANLSLACEISNRNLIIFDSFSGLPEPAADDRDHFTATGVAGTYEKGFWGGELEEVRSNISQFGSVKRCRFVKDTSMKLFPIFEIM